MKKGILFLSGTSLIILAAAIFVYFNSPVIDCSDSCRTKEEIAWATVNISMEAPLMAFRFYQGRYPSGTEGIRVLYEKNGFEGDVYKGPYLREPPIDPWGREYHYENPATKSENVYDLYSLGADGIESYDDIGNWSPNPKQSD